MITVSVVSHGQQDLVLRLLKQLDLHCSAAIDKLILTANLPQDRVVPSSGWHFPVMRIDNAEPMGFGANHNQAFRHCRSAWFLVINPDIEIDSDVLSPLLAQARPEDGVLSPAIREPHKPEPEPERALITPWEIVARRWLGKAPPAAPLWLAGMFLLLRSQAFRQLKGFDRRYHMYCEDFDLSARLQIKGWQLRRINDLQVRHAAQRSSHASVQYLWWHVQSLMRMWLSQAFWRLWWRQHRR